MSLTAYCKQVDKFELHDGGHPRGLCFPCNACKHSVVDSNCDPCRMCGHNAAAVCSKNNLSDPNELANLRSRCAALEQSERQLRETLEAVRHSHETASEENSRLREALETTSEILASKTGRINAMFRERLGYEERIRNLEAKLIDAQNYAASCLESLEREQAHCRELQEQVDALRKQQPAKEKVCEWKRAHRSYGPGAFSSECDNRLRNIVDHQGICSGCGGRIVVKGGA